MKKLLLLLPFLALTACHAQVPPTTHSVDLAWHAPVPVSGGIWQTACGTAAGQSPCTYILSRASVTSGTGPCPPVSTSGTANYIPLNSGSPATGLAYTDTTATGVVCYIAQTVQLATTGGASNIVQATVPANPGAPTLGNGTVARLDRPQAPMPSPADAQVASEQAPKLEAHIQ